MRRRFPQRRELAARQINAAVESSFASVRLYLWSYNRYKGARRHTSKPPGGARRRIGLAFLWLFYLPRPVIARLGEARVLLYTLDEDG